MTNYFYTVFMVQDVIHVVESKPTKSHGDYFLRQILKVLAHPILSNLSSTDLPYVLIFWMFYFVAVACQMIWFLCPQFEEMIGELEKVQFDWAW